MVRGVVCDGEWCGCLGWAAKKEVKKETGLGLAFKKEDNFGEWYSDVSNRLKMLDNLGMLGLKCEIIG